MKPTLLRTFLAASALVLLTLAAVLPARADYSNTVMSLSPVGYWRLSETAAVPAANIVSNAGSLGEAANGFAIPGTALGFAQPGVVGNSITFSNNVGGANNWDPNSVINVPWSAALNPQGPFTIEFWGKPTGKIDADILVAVSSMNTGQSRSGWLMYHNTGGGTAGFDNNWEFRIGGTASYAYTIDSPSGSGALGVWAHVVGVYDGTYARLYVNGQLVGAPQAITAGRNFNPNNSKPFRIGAWDGSGFGRNFDGTLDEVAFYNTALSANSISNHYYMGINNKAGYAVAILADGPAGYWPLDEPVYTPPNPSTFPVAANSGTLGAAANGTCQPGVTAGIAGPPFAGFGAPNPGVKLSGMAGNVALGSPAGLNFSGPISMVAWVKSTDSLGLRNIVSHGFRAVPDGEVEMRIQDGNYNVGSWGPDSGNPGEGASSTGGLASGDAAGGIWVFLAGTYDGANWNLYRYDSLIASGPGTVGAMIFDAPWSIGSRGDTSVGDERYFPGGIDEVAIFDKALTAAEVRSIFYSAQMSPVIRVAPQAPVGTVYEGAPVTFTAEAVGNPTLLYQWTKNGAALPGKTTTVLAFASTLAADSGTYAIVVTNNYGSVTSSVVLTVVGSAPVILAQPQPASRFTGAPATFSVTAGGTAPLTYQWKLEGSPVPGATTSALTRTASPAVAGNYSCTISNSYGSTNTANAAFTVLPAPTGYSAVALADSPIAYLRLGETNGTVAHDYWGGHDGVFNSVTLGVPGYSGFDPDKAAGFTGANNSYVSSISGIDFGSATPTFSLEAWVNGPATQVGNATIIGKGRGPSGGGGVPGWQFVLDVTSGAYRFYVEAASGTPANGTATAAVGPDGTWQHVVAVYDGPGNSMQLYVNGVSSGSGAPPGLGPLASLSPVSIGAGAGGVTPIYDLPFAGTIDEVAIYSTALAADRVLAHFESSYGLTTPPFITKQPVAVTNYETMPVTFSVGAAGTQPLSYQWKKGGVDVGANEPALTFNSVALGDAGNYSVRVSNTAGVTNSATVALTVLPAPATPIQSRDLVMHLPFDDSLIDATGRGNNGTKVGNTTYVAGKVGTKALHYYTDTNDPPSYNYVTLGVRPDLQFGSTTDFSVAFWVFQRGDTIPNDLPFFGNATNSANNPGYVFCPSYPPIPRGSWQWSLKGTDVGGIAFEGPEEWSIYDLTSWHHLVFTFDRNGLGITYLDGRQVDSQSVATIGNLDSGYPTVIGQGPGGRYPEVGAVDIDDIGVWRRALSALEAAEIYVAANVNGVSFVRGISDVTLTIEPKGTRLKLTWPTGTLESADAVTGPYTEVSGATSGVLVTPDAAKKFYRVRQ